MRIKSLIYISALLTLFSNVQAANYNEAINGDFSNSGLNTTTVSLNIGSNLIRGNLGGDGSVVDRDYFTISIPQGAILNGIKLLADSDIGSEFSFIGLQSENQVTLAPDTETAEGLLGWWHYSFGDLDTDLLSKMAQPANGSSGFTAPLTSGNYSFWIQELSAGSYNYGLEFTVSQEQISEVPVPAAYLLFLSGAGIIGWLNKRRNCS